MASQHSSETVITLTNQVSNAVASVRLRSMLTTYLITSACQSVRHSFSDPHVCVFVCMRERERERERKRERKREREKDRERERGRERKRESEREREREGESVCVIQGPPSDITWRS